MSDDGKCDVCGKPFSDTFGPILAQEVVIDIAVAHRGNGIEHQFPAESILSWKGKMCGDCIYIPYSLAVMFERWRREHREARLPKAKVHRRPPWILRLFGGA